MAPVNGTVFRAPSTFQTSARPVRIAGMTDAPFLIINTSVTSTVWLSSNPGITAGVGTPLNPGTSYNWNNPTDVWAVCNTGETAELIVTTEVSDWQPDPVAIASAILNAGVLVVDRPVVILDAVTIDGSNHATAQIDTSHYQSMIVEVFFNATGGGAIDQLFIVFYDDNNNQVGQHAIRYHPTHGAFCRFTFPLRGSTVQFTNGAASSSFIVNATLSARHVESIYTEIRDSVTQDPCGYDAFSASLAAAATLDLWIPPVFGTLQARTRVTTANPINNSVLFLAKYNSNRGAFDFNIDSIALAPNGANIYTAVMTWTSNGEATRISLLNNTVGAIANVGITATLVSGAGVL